MRASELVGSEQVYEITADDNIQKASQIMSERNVGCLPVVDREGRLEGVITDRDIVLRGLAQGKDFNTRVGDVMSKPVHTVHPDTDIHEVERLMERFKIRRLILVDESNKLRGIISLGDLAKHYHGLMQRRRLAEVLETVSS